MIVTTSNILLGNTPTVIDGINAVFDTANITDPDFSTLYTSSSNSVLSVSFGATGAINYVAVAGVNIEGAKNFTSNLAVVNGSTVIARNFVSANGCIVATFPSMSFSDLRISLINASADKPPSIRFCAAGNALTIPNGGEQAGYNRQFLNRNRKTISSLNSLAAPTSYLVNTMAPKGTLKVPNVTKGFSENEWQDFLTFSDVNYFFVREQSPAPIIDGAGTQSTNNDSAYLCFEPTGIKTTAHGQTRSLNNLSITFKVFTGL
ncbi:MAG TPA: hypothetical protein EYN67_09810 [Flavobacteriales bacterium]|nr:hypothetical protein [Methylococcaceae bacterium]HHZ95829.1 hypothetical protein [Flavobacteriales bacterium]